LFISFLKSCLNVCTMYIIVSRGFMYILWFFPSFVLLFASLYFTAASFSLFNEFGTDSHLEIRSWWCLQSLRCNRNLEKMRRGGWKIWNLLSKLYVLDVVGPVINEFNTKVILGLFSLRSNEAARLRLVSISTVKHGWGVLAYAKHSLRVLPYRVRPHVSGGPAPCVWIVVHFCPLRSNSVETADKVSLLANNALVRTNIDTKDKGLSP